MTKQDIIDYINKYPDTTFINFSSSNITELPDEICNLQNVTIMFLDFNDISTLPINFGNLKLKWLTLRNNKLTEFPLKILASLYVNGLVRIDLGGNPISNLPNNLLGEEPQFHGANLRRIIDYVVNFSESENQNAKREKENKEILAKLENVKADTLIESLLAISGSIDDNIKKNINSGILIYRLDDYISSLRILFPIIEEITNKILLRLGQTPFDYSIYKGLADKLKKAKDLGIVSEDLVQAINLSAPRNAMVHGSYNPVQQELMYPLCLSAMRSLYELIINYNAIP